MFVTAKEFCKTTGFPARTLARYLHEGRIDCHCSLLSHQVAKATMLLLGIFLSICNHAFVFLKP